MNPEAPGRRAADDPLVISERRLRRAQQVARLGSWELDLVTRVMWGSDEAFRVYGLPITPDHSLPYDEVRHIPLDDDRPRLDRALHELVTAGRSYEIRFRIRRRDDGAIRYVHSFAEATCDDHGRPVLVTGTIQDVTESEEAAQTLQNALRANEERARLILEQAADAIFIGTQTGGFSRVNEQACALTGYRREELLGAGFSLLFRPAVLTASPLRYDLVGRGEKIVQERVLTRKDGREVLVEMSTKTLSDGTVQSIVRDITERRRLEEQLFLRQRMDSLGTLAAGIAHDFNNVLAAIVGFADALRLSGELTTPHQQRSVDSILASCQRAADLIRGLQRLTHPEPHEIASFDLHAVAVEVFRVLDETTDRLIAKQMLIPPGRFHVLGDASGIYHALMNLGINAVQAIEQKGPVAGDMVRVEADERVVGPHDTLSLPPGRYVHIQVIDSGPGMSAAVREHAFDPLFTTKEKGPRKGQGLGLTATYNIVVRHHRGLIEIESEPGCGATVHLFLPRGGVPATVPESGQPSIRGGTETILVIEDEPDIVAVFREALESLGYTVHAALDGQHGVELFREHLDDVDLVLLDLTIPTMPGTEVLRHLRLLRPGVPVVISSGDVSVITANLPGVARVLQKPYNLSVLATTLREVLDDGRTP